jgi:hypothetical protein
VNPLFSSKKTTPVFLVPLLLACVAFLPQTQAALDLTPPPDGCYRNFTAAEGCNPLHSLTTGAGNTGLGWHSLFSDTDASFNTGVGAETLVLNNAEANTAIGFAALKLNQIGLHCTANGALALFSNGSTSRGRSPGPITMLSAL